MSIYDKCRAVGKWEIENRVSEDKCITRYFGDYGMWVPKFGVKNADVDKKYKVIKEKKK